MAIGLHPHFLTITPLPRMFFFSISVIVSVDRDNRPTAPTLIGGSELNRTDLVSPWLGKADADRGGQLVRLCFAQSSILW
jgi:hypothetical protein